MATFDGSIESMQNSIRDQLTGLAPYNAIDNELVLFTENVAISPTLTLAELVEADFGGYARITMEDAAILRIDPATGNAILRFPDPAGGWVFTASGSPPANTPQNIWGAAVIDAGGNLLGVHKFDAAQIITAASQVITIGSVDFPVANPLTGVTE